MKKIQLTNQELIQLQNEIVGTSPESGLLSLKMSVLTKYKLNKLVKTIKDELASYHTVNEDLIQKYGESSSTGGITIPFYIDEKYGDEIKKVENPNLEKYFNEINPVLQTLVDIEVPEISIIEFKDTETTENYPILFEKIISLN